MMGEEMAVARMRTWRPGELDIGVGWEGYSMASGDGDGYGASGPMI